MKNLDLIKRYTEQHLGHPLERAQPLKLNGDQVSEVLWPLNELFRPNQEAIQSLSYDAQYEREADAAISGFAFDPGGYDWSTVSSGAWRVFMERHYQTLMLAGLQLQTPFLSVPLNLPARARLGFLLLFQYHEMALPFPVQDRSGGGMPQPNAPGTLLRH